MSEIKQNLTCPICLDWLVFSAVTDCGHSFCTSCIQTVALAGEKEEYNCPKCKGVITRAPSPDYEKDDIVEKCVDKLEGAEGKNAYHKRKENTRKMQSARKGDSVKCHYIFVGNPGLGKSTLINSFLQKRVFDSGPSFGAGLTKFWSQAEVEEGIFVDTPGLDDIAARKKAAEEISKALKLTGSYRLFFVVGLEVGRVRPQDCATMRLVLNACREIPEFQSEFRYSVIINKLTNKIKQKIEHDEQARQEVLAGLFNDMWKTTSSIYYAPIVLDIMDAENELFEMPEDMKRFITYAPDVLIPSKRVNGVEASEFEHMQEVFETQISDLRQQFDKQTEIMDFLLTEKRDWELKAQNLENLRRWGRAKLKEEILSTLAIEAVETDGVFDSLDNID